MILRFFQNASSLADAAAESAADLIRQAISDRGCCRIVLATGNSQVALLEALTKKPGIDWKKVEAFHLDEYVGMSSSHPASFRKFLTEKVTRKTGIVDFHPVKGDAEDLAGAVRELGRELTSAPVDVAFVGIGENGHIAFNDPPADFETQEPYLVVPLDDRCRRQQVGEGWFGDLSQVPIQAISMSPQQIMKAEEIVCVVPDRRKADAVRMCLQGAISPMAPASILRRHTNVTVYVDADSASLLDPELLSSLRTMGQAIVD